MPYQNWADLPGERRCVNCDQRLVADAPVVPEATPAPPEPTVHYVCPDNHERWSYNSQSREWRQMY